MLARGGGSWLFQFQFVNDDTLFSWEIAVEDLDFFFALVRSRRVCFRKENAGGSPRVAAELTAREGSFALYRASARSFVS